MSWNGHDLTFDLAVVTSSLISCLGYISETLMCRKLILDRDIG